MVNVKKKKKEGSHDENETRPRIINEQMIESSSRLEAKLDQPVILLSTQEFIQIHFKGYYIIVN